MRQAEDILKPGKYRSEPQSRAVCCDRNGSTLSSQGPCGHRPLENVAHLNGDMLKYKIHAHYRKNKNSLIRFLYTILHVESTINWICWA